MSHKQLARSSACGVLRIQNPTFPSISAVFLSRLLSPSEIKGPIPRANAAISGGQPKPCDASVDQFEYLLPLFWVVVCVFALFVYRQIPAALGGPVVGCVRSQRKNAVKNTFVPQHIM